MGQVQGVGDEDRNRLLVWFEQLIAAAIRKITAIVAGRVGAEPTRAAVSVDDLGAIPAQWTTGVDASLLPALGLLYEQAAAFTAGGIVEQTGGALTDLASPDAAAFMAAARNRLVRIGDLVWDVTRTELVAGMQAGETVNELAARVSAAAGVAESRALVIARTEALSAMNAASLAQVRVLNDPTAVKEWAATPGRSGLTGTCDDRTRPEHCKADGQRVRVNEKFNVGGSHLDFPGDPTGPPELIIQCRCSMFFDLDDEPSTMVAASSDFHLPGSHDQSAHGGDGPDVDVPASPYPGMRAATDEDRAEFRVRMGKAIPPAWTDVYIAEDLDTAKLLVRGKDAKGRGQSVYSATHTQSQAAVKFGLDEVGGVVVSTEVAPFDRDEERRLLEDWLSTVDFDDVPAGVPAMAADPDDDEEDVAPVVIDDGVLVSARSTYDEATDVRRDRNGKFAEVAEVATDVAGDLQSGHPATCSPGVVDALMGELADGPPCNLGLLQVRGGGNERCFREHARDIPRSRMPQLPKSADQLGPLGDVLRQAGVTVELDSVDPRLLRATQNQLNGQAVGALYRRIHAGTWNGDAVTITSRDGDVLDGHHRWAAAAAATIAGRATPLRVLRVDLDIDSLLEYAQTVSGPRKVHGAPRPEPVVASVTEIGEQPVGAPPDPDEPWLWVDGGWVLIASDTADGVPEELNFPDDDGVLTAGDFHLPGKHNQQDHAGHGGKRRTGGAGSGKRKSGPLTDEAMESRQRLVEQVIGKARHTLATDVVHSTDGAWEPERDQLHRDIAADLYRAAADVPNDGKAIIAGGLGGAGKSTVLRDYAGVDAREYLTVNPDDIKEELARRELIPEVPGVPELSPMERAALVHEESSRIGLLLADMAYRERKNVIWDVTMSSEGSARSRVAALERAGYGQIKGVFVDIPVEVSVTRAMARYHRGVNDWVAGEGLGGRFVPPSIIRAQETSSGRSINRGVFESLQGVFSDWSMYDNSVNGRAPQLISESTSALVAGSGGLDERGSVVDRTVMQLLDDLTAGAVTVDEVAEVFAGRSWPVRAPTTDAEAWGAADSAVPGPDSWGAVSADSRLTADQYATLTAAYGRAPRHPASRERGLVPVDEAGTAIVAATAAEHTGAMIALIPSAADAARLAVDGGEPVDELHVTLLYLGEAADIPADAQTKIVDRVAALVGEVVGPDLEGPLRGDGFAVSVFNPGTANEAEPCVVLGVSGVELDGVHGLVEEAVNEVDAADDGWELPDQHAPWAAHVTLKYVGESDPAAEVAALTDRVGPVTFDRVRVVFAGDATDIPLTGGDTPEPEPEPETEPEPEPAETEPSS